MTNLLTGPYDFRYHCQMTTIHGWIEPQTGMKLVLPLRDTGDQR